jgi:hypothetical protein
MCTPGQGTDLVFCDAKGFEQAMGKDPECELLNVRIVL